MLTSSPISVTLFLPFSKLSIVLHSLASLPFLGLSTSFYTVRSSSKSFLYLLGSSLLNPKILFSFLNGYLPKLSPSIYILHYHPLRDTMLLAPLPFLTRNHLHSNTHYWSNITQSTLVSVPLTHSKDGNFTARSSCIMREFRCISVVNRTSLVLDEH